MAGAAQGLVVLLALCALGRVPLAPNFVLMALPVPRRVIFGAKLLALALFALLFTLAAHIALLPLSILMSMGLFVGVPFPVQFIAYLVGSLLGSVFAVMAVVAIQGLLILSAPRGGLLTVSAVLRSAFLCAMVIALPLVMRLPGTSLEDLLARSRKERTYPIVCRNLGIPCDTERSVFARQALARHQGDEILAQIEALPLKGLHLAHRVYPSPSLRDMGDLDLLVRRSRLRDAGASVVAAVISLLLPAASRMSETKSRTSSLSRTTATAPTAAR
jgi:hypothetical protein